MAKQSNATPKRRYVKSMIGAGIDDQLDRRALARAPDHPMFAVFRRGPVVKFADQNYGWNGQLLGRNAAKWVIGDGGLELQVFRNGKKFDVLPRSQPQRNDSTLR